MEVLITGAGGFIGRALVARLRAGATVRDAQGRLVRPQRLVLCDVEPGSSDDQAFGGIVSGQGPHDGKGLPEGKCGAGAMAEVGVPPALAWRIGSVADRAFVRTLVSADTACVFHLAGVVSGAAEADFDAGMRVNLDGTRNLLEALAARPAGAGRHSGNEPGVRRPVRLVHASSIAVYGMPLPPQIDDGTQPWPTLSYGAHKLAGELLVNDLSRRGLVDGRSLRLSGVIVRPAQPNGALSAFNSDIFRETLAGRPVVSPVSPAATIWVQTIGRTVDNLLHAAALEPAAFGRQRAVLLPALACRIDEIVAAIAEVAGPEARQLVSYRPDERVEPMFGRWPKPFTATRGRDLGFTADEDLVSMVRGFAAARMGSA